MIVQQNARQDPPIPKSTFRYIYTPPIAIAVGFRSINELRLPKSGMVGKI